MSNMINALASFFRHEDIDRNLVALVGSTGVWHADHLVDEQWGDRAWIGLVHEYGLHLNALAGRCFVVRCKNHVHAYPEDARTPTPTAAVRRMLADRMCEAVR